MSAAPPRPFNVGGIPRSSASLAAAVAGAPASNRGRAIIAGVAVVIILLVARSMGGSSVPENSVGGGENNYYFSGGGGEGGELDATGHSRRGQQQQEYAYGNKGGSTRGGNLAAMCPSRAPCPKVKSAASKKCPVCEDAEPCPEPEPCPETPSVGSNGAVSSEACEDALYVNAGTVEAGIPAVPAWRRGPQGYPPSNRANGGFFARMRDWGFNPSVILDVGANEGNWARMIWDFYGGTSPKVLMVEGSEHRAQTLMNTGFDFMVSVVGAQTKYIEFYSDEKAHTGNSVLQENTRHFKSVTPTRVVMRTLDELMASYGATQAGGVTPRPQLLKLDVQGYELEVLRGSRKTLESVEVILMETGVLPYNKGAPLTGQVMGFMDRLGFQVLDMLETHTAGPSNTLIQLDFAFVRKGSKYIDLANQAAGIMV